MTVAVWSTILNLLLAVATNAVIVMSSGVICVLCFSFQHQHPFTKVLRVLGVHPTFRKGKSTTLLDDFFRNRLPTHGGAGVEAEESRVTDRTT